MVGCQIISQKLVLFEQMVQKRKRKVLPIEEFVPKIPPHEIALEKLKKLEEEKLWQKGEVKLFHSNTTEIIREYIEQRFSIPALESTTDEILDNFKKVDLNGELKNILREMLVLADLVKFAKAKPLPDENEKTLQWAYQFVRETIENKIKEEKIAMNFTN